MKIAFVVLLVFASCGLSFGQQTTGNATTEAPCSPAVTGGSNNTFVFRYCGSDPEEAKRIRRLLDAIANGELVTNAKLDQVLEILNRPTKMSVSASFVVAAPAGGHPRAAVNFSTEDPVDRGQFEVVCDRACTPIDVCRLMGANQTILSTVVDHPEIAVFSFLRSFPQDTACGLTVESRDDRPVEIIGVRTSNRTIGLIRNPVQPSRVVTSGNSTIGMQ
jgi:hypothetical protein